MRKYDYIGFFVDKETLLNKLTGRDHLELVVNEPHVTLKYRPKTEEVLEDLFGQKVSIIVNGYAKDDRTEGLSVSLVADNDQLNAQIAQLDKPFITVSRSKEAKPQDAAELSFEPIDNFMITGEFKGYLFGAHGRKLLIGKPFAKKEEEAQADQTEAAEAKPEAKTEKAAKTEAKTEKAAKPEAKTEKTAKPEAKTEKAAKPEAKTEKAAKPEAKTEKAAKLEAKTEKAAKTEAKTEKAAKTEAKTEKAAKAGTTYIFPVYMDGKFKSGNVNSAFWQTLAMDKLQLKAAMPYINSALKKSEVIRAYELKRDIAGFKVPFTSVELYYFRSGIGLICFEAGAGDGQESKTRLADSLQDWVKKLLPEASEWMPSSSSKKNDLPFIRTSCLKGGDRSKWRVEPQGQASVAAGDEAGIRDFRLLYILALHEREARAVYRNKEVMLWNKAMRLKQLKKEIAEFEVLFSYKVVSADSTYQTYYERLREVFFLG